MKKQKIGVYPHRVYCYQGTDFRGNVTLDKLLNMLLDSAGTHADENGFGRVFMDSVGCTWVLSRLNMELHSTPRYYEKLYIHTWIREMKSAFSFRVFEVRTEQDELLASATTLWSVIDVEKRKLVPMRNIIKENEMLVPVDVKAEMPQRFSFEKGNICREVRAGYSDLDFNGHVNSNVYIQWALNSFDLDFWKENYLNQIEVNFNHEIYYDDCVSVCKSNKESFYCVELYNEIQHQTACRLRLHFEKNNLVHK